MGMHPTILYGDSDGATAGEALVSAARSGDAESARALCWACNGASSRPALLDAELAAREAGHGPLADELARFRDDAGRALVKACVMGNYAAVLMLIRSGKLPGGSPPVVIEALEQTVLALACHQSYGLR